MPILEMLFQAIPQVGRQPDIVELPAAIQRIDPLPPPRILPGNILMPFQCLSGDVLQVLTN
jgi:hypothetical protein